VGSTASAASSELKSLAAAMQTEFHLPPDWTDDAHVVGLHDAVVGGARRMLWLLFGGVVFMLMIATANVANFLLVRAAERRQELALRLALGASSFRVARLLLSESLVLGVIGGAFGVAAAFAIVRFLPALLPRDLPRLGEVVIDPGVLAFAVVATILPALAVGFAPVMHSRRNGLAGALREVRGARGERTRGALVAAEVCLALILMVGAALMGRSLNALLSVDVGFKADHLLSARLQPSGMRSPEETRVFWREALARVEAVPDVTSAATILHLPTSGRSWHADIEVDGRPLSAGTAPPRAAWQSVSTNFFATAGVPVISGRAFERTDVAGTPRVIVVNSAFARALFPNDVPVRHRIKAGFATEREWATIVGVVGGVRHDSLNSPPVPEVYVPFEQHMVGATSLVVRVKGDAAALAPAVRNAIWSIRRDVPVDEMRTMDAVLSGSLQRPRMILEILAFFAFTGLVFGAVGIYGVVAFGVEQRRRELGIRAALGADADNLVRLVVRSGLRFAGIGVLIGIPISVGLSSVMRGLVFGVTPTDPTSFVLGALVLLAVAVVASWVPARRASRVEPMEVLRGVDPNARLRLQPKLCRKNSLLGPQRLDRVHAHRAPRGHKTGKGRHGDKQRHTRREHQRIGGRDAIQRRTHHLGGR
jgi:predicted permease